MQQLIDQITERYNISEEEATGIINTVVNYAEEKSSGLGNSLSKAFDDDTEEGEEQTSNADENNQHDITEQSNLKQQTVAAVSTANVQAGEDKETMFKKAKDFVEGHIPGGMKEKAEEAIGEMGGKLKGFFN